MDDRQAENSVERGVSEKGNAMERWWSDRSPVPEIVLIAALWPVWIWYAGRITVPWDEPWGALALITAVAFFLRRPPVAVLPRGHLLLPTALTLLYAASYPFLPPILSAAVALTALGALLSVRRLGVRMHPAACGLLLLSLPVIPALQFYIGYSLRCLTAVLASPLLQLNGLSVFADGTCLNWNGSLVSVDAPCSGIRMLWTGLYLTLALACFRNLGGWRTLAAVPITVVAVMLGNVLRTAALFYLETGIVSFPSWAHDGAGLVIFLFTALFIGWWTLQLERRGRCEPFTSS